MARRKVNIDWILSQIESKWSLWNLVLGTGLAASFGLPAWAVHSASIFAEYSPLSWVVSGFIGVFVAVIAYLIYAFASKLRVTAQYNAMFLEKGILINPLETIFERKRILLNDFVLPSHTLIENKTFVDCDLIGPANIYFLTSNNVSPIRQPIIDAVWLSPKASFRNGFVFSNCVFRNCSFQRITMFASVENYLLWKNHPSINWISIPPSQLDIEERNKIVSQEGPKKEEVTSGPVPRIEGPK
jgi:hypothetical protein